MQRKLFVSALAFILAAVGMKAHAADDASSLRVVVQQTDGTQTSYQLDASPRITYGEGVVMLVAGEQSVELEASQVVRIFLQKETQGIDAAKASQPNVAISRDAMSVKGLEPGSDVSLYSTDGRCLQQGTVAADGSLSLSLSQKAQGVVIVKTKNQTFKIINKK